MPTYEYRCNECDHLFEEFQSISAKALRKCPECGKLKLERLIGTGAGIIFKGSGFYETDYRSESYKKGADKEKGAGDGGDGAEKQDKKGDAGKTEKKSAGKSEAPAPSKKKHGGSSCGPSCACSS